jgi:hypothetical protein
VSARPWREHGLVLAGFALLTIVLTWPVAALFGQAINAFGDVVVQMTTMTWDAHALATNPLGLFDAPFFYPYAHTNAYSEHLVGETLVALPILWLTGDPAPAHNFNFLLSFVLTGYATYLLVRDLTGNRIAAVAAGIAYAFAGYRFVQSGHMQTLATEWFPFTLWALRRGLRWNHGGYIALAAAGVIGMGLFSVYYIFFLAILVGLYLAWWLLIDRPAPATDAPPMPRRSRLPLWAKLGLAGVMAGIVLLPFYLPYVQVNQELGFNRSVYEVQSWAARPWYFWNVLATNWLWATLVPDMIGLRGERQLFPGLIISVLAAAGLLFAGWRRAPAPGDSPSAAPVAYPRERWFYLLLGLVALVLTFGMSIRLPGTSTDIPLPYAFLYDWVPGFSALRVPVRFAALLNLALAVLGGYGLAWLLGQIRRPRRAALLWVPLLALMTLEYVQVRDLSNHRDMRPPASGPYSYLAGHPGPVIELPMYGSDADVWYTYGATYHWQPLVNGFSSFVPPGTVEIAHAMAAFPDPASLALLQGLEVRHVVVRYSQFPLAGQPGLRKRIESTPALRQVYAQGSDVIYEIAPDPWASRIATALPADGYLWVDRGSTNSAPALEALAYALKYNRLPTTRLPVPADHVAGNLILGYKPLPPLPYGRPADVALAPAGDPAGGGGAGAGAGFYKNPLAALYRRDADLQAHYDLTAPASPYAPHGLAIPAGGARFDLPAAQGSAARVADLLFAAFAPTEITVNGAPLTLAPGLTRYRGPAGDGLDLRATSGADSAALLAVDVLAADGTAPGSGQGAPLPDTLVLDVQPSTADLRAGTVTTNWRIVPRHPGGQPFTLSLDIYQKPFGTHPDGHLGTWSLPLPAGAEGRSYSLTLDPAAKTATATLNGGGTEVFMWQGPPRGGDFHATLNLYAGDHLLAQLPVYDFSLDGGRLGDFAPAPGTVLRLPFAAQ